MASTLVLVLQLLLVSLASASHHFGGMATYSYKGRNPDGTFRVDIRERATFDGCQYSHHWNCYNGNCGYTSRNEGGTLDRSTNAPISNRQWCETETVRTLKVPSDKPFEMRKASCCWIPTRNGVSSWRLRTSVDLGTRSDTGQPNRSPDIAILPFLRVPQNCPRTYKLMSFDPDGDKVQCRYGNSRNIDCSSCNPPSGFNLDQDSCTLHYNNTSADPRVNAFEMVVEDFPQGHITLAYTDGSRSYRAPLNARRKRQVVNPSALPWWWSQLYGTSTTIAPSTSVPTTPWWWYWHGQATAVPTTTTAAPTTPWWWYWHGQSTTEPTSTTVPTTPWRWYWQRQSTAAPTTTTASPTTTTAAPTTTTAAPTTTTTDPTTTTTIPTTPWRWYRQRQSTTTLTTTKATPTTTTAASWTTTPLSVLPLQFSLLVDPPAPSCQEGQYLPKFVQPTPENGAHIQAEVNKEVEIRVKAEAAYATIHDLIMSGPLNISKHRTTHEEFVIRWTPVPDDLGEHYAICFAVESVTGSAVSVQTTQHHHHSNSSSQSGIYQSEMRCVLVEIRKEQVKSNVICTESTMIVEVEKSSFPGLHEDHLQLNEPSNTACSLQKHSNSTHFIAVIPLNACGTQIEEDDQNLIFKNVITTVDNIEDLITRKHLLEMQFYCQYPKRGNVTLGFTAHRQNVTVWERGFGTFTYQFEFYPNNHFQTMMDPNNYPLVYDIGSRIYMELEATSSVNNTELFVLSCTAAPYDNPNYWPKYSIIENGCVKDSTVEIYSPAHKRQFRFSVAAFTFIGLHHQVYISCEVLMCEAGNPNTRCSQGCINSTSSGSHQHHHHKREIITQSATHFVSQGPLRLRRSEERTESSVMNLNLNLVFIAGCLLAAVGMISAVAMYKTRMSRLKYQPLPTFES